MLKALFLPAIAAMNRMNFVVKFLFIGLVLLLPFAYVTQIMVKGSDRQITFNQKESYGVDYITPGSRLLAHLQDCRTYSAAILAGEGSLRKVFTREKHQTEALIPWIDALDERHREDFKTNDGRNACTERWTEIKKHWDAVKTQEFKTQEESFAAYSELCALVTDWILNYAANYSNLILDPDLDSYWLMDAFVGKMPQITEGMSQACALGIALASRPKRGGGAPASPTADEKLGIHGLYVEATAGLKALQEVNLKTAYSDNNTRSKTLQTKLEPLVGTTTILCRNYLESVKHRIIRADTPQMSPGELVEESQKAMDAAYALHVSLGPELKGLIDARVRAYQHDKTLGVIAAGSATFLFLYLFFAFFFAIHASVAQISRFTRRMIEGTREHFKLDSHDELGRVADSYNQINETLVETRALKGELESKSGALKESEERFRTLASRAPVGIFQTDAQGNCLYVNERWSQLASMTPEEAKGPGWIRALHPDDRDRVSLEWYAAAREHRDFSAEYRFSSPQGTVWLSGNAVALRDQSGVITGFLGSVADITQQKRVERLKNEFISTVSHELRTPLTSIRGSLGLIAGGIAGVLTPKAESMIEIARRNCERLVRLVSDILDIEKIESGNMTFDIRSIDLAPLLEQAVEANRGFAQSLGVSLALELSAGGARVSADSDRLTQVVTNLLSNACKFSPKGGTVTIRLGVQGDHIRIAVQDQGSGIPDEFRSRIFQKFAQADGSDGRAKQGTGLGLSICKAIVERMGGRIGFDSSPGQGTTFFFDLPPQSRPVLRVTPHRSDRPTVLVCEDDGDIASILRGILEGAGYNVDLANSAAQAKEQLAQNQYIGMTLDLAMPGQDGISLLRELRENPATRQLPVIVVSAFMEEGRKSIKGDAFGILDWLEKPIDEIKLKSALSHATASLGGGKPRILHVEDDPDIFRIVQGALSGRALLIQSETLDDARQRIKREAYDLIILDITLPDGSGLELLPALQGGVHGATPVVIFSAHEVSSKIARHVQAVFLKSKTSNAELVETISSILEGSLHPRGRDLIGVSE